MKIYLAGINGRREIIENYMKIYLAGGGTTKTRVIKTIHDDMNIFLAGTPPWRESGLYDKTIAEHKPFILESFYYVNSDTERLLPYYGDFLLDSGAFTFMYNSKTHVDWKEYIEKYAEFINRNNVQKFFELDIDNVVGYSKVLEYRKYLESLTNRQCIPVWHINRGLDEYKKMCDEYSYVALGGIVGELKHGTKYKQYHSMFPMFISEAHKRKAKIHGLGFTALERLKECHFDSVDSTAWTTGNRFGYVYKFDGRTIKKIECPKGKRLGKPQDVALINYTEWIKFQKYAEVHL